MGIGSRVASTTSPRENKAHNGVPNTGGQLRTKLKDVIPAEQQYAICTLSLPCPAAFGTPLRALSSLRLVGEATRVPICVTDRAIGGYMASTGIGACCAHDLAVSPWFLVFYNQPGQHSWSCVSLYCNGVYYCRVQSSDVQ